ncbi:MAG: transcriptional regulator EpsA [Candidatus Thermoplasmatota archaeon]|nr:transcriptional regulator EpsA [Candidatus Thermoplasmatota archaeon]
MHHANELTDEECGHLARILLASRRVMLRHHFFSWAHGPVQALIPHEILLCGVADESGYLLHERFTACRYFRDVHYHRVIHPGDGLINQLAQEWQAFGEPRLIAAQHDDPGGWNARLTDLELKNVAFHGMGWINGQIKGYASFSRVRAPFDGRLALYIDILLPPLLATLARVLANEARTRANSSRPIDLVTARRPISLVTVREAEVLAWVRDGKTNDEIAAIIGLSKLTVKNHLRNVMKKLNVHTRGQAIAKAIALGFLRVQSVRGDAEEAVEEPSG